MFTAIFDEITVSNVSRNQNGRPKMTTISDPTPFSRVPIFDREAG